MILSMFRTNRSIAWPSVTEERRATSKQPTCPLKYNCPNKSANCIKNSGRKEEIWRVFAQPSYDQCHRKRQHLKCASHRELYDARWRGTDGMAEAKPKQIQKDALKERHHQSQIKNKPFVHVRSTANAPYRHAGPMMSDCQLRRDPGVACSRFVRHW